jgi:predicted phosphatase
LENYHSIWEKSDSLYVHALVINTNEQQKLDQALDQIESYAKINDFNSIILRLNTYNSDLIQWLLKRGYLLKKTSVRMIYKGDYTIIKGVDISGWVM